MFRQGKKTAAASGVAATSAAAGTAAAAAPIGTKIAAGIAAALLTVTAAGVIVHQSASEPTAPTAEATPTNQWIGYGTDLLPQFIRRFELTADTFTEEKITGHLTVSEMYDISHDSDLEGTGTKNEDGTITYTVTF